MYAYSRPIIAPLLCLALSRWKASASVFLTGLGSDDEERLIIDKFRGYNHLIRPVLNVNSTPIVVEFGLAMILLINVDEKNQIMQTNVWLTMKWHDYQMTWNPKEYGNITTIRVPPDKVWLPDIVLFNNADGNYEVSFYSNVVVDFKGGMLWVPPAIYKSSCRIDVEYFPFDEQTCKMTFGSWTYNSKEVTLDWYNKKKRVELNDYSFSGIWDIMNVPGQLNSNRSQVEFDVVIRRKTLFYTVILIIPTVLMAFLSMMVFYLPADCSEKITLAISILLALVVFLLLVSKILPPTSDTIPLMAKYLLMTFVMNIITILVTVIIINVYFRGPTTHQMSPWVNRVFLHILPQLLLMKRPKQESLWSTCTDLDMQHKERDSPSHRLFPPSYSVELDDSCMRGNHVPLRHHPNCMVSRSFMNDSHDSLALMPPDSLSREAKRALDAIQYVTNHLKSEDDHKKTRDDWKYVAMVIDRLLLYVFFGVTMGGTLGILLSAPNVFDVSCFVGTCSEDEERLIVDMFKGYNSLIRPVPSVNATSVLVSFSLAMILLINVDEKNQIMQTNVWLTMKWFDYQLQWDPEKYGKIKTIRVPPDKVWLPDIVLFNNADGNYEVSFYSNVVIEYTGQMLWVPPAIYKSSCTIDVEYFPFDEQTCSMIFGSWTFNKDEVQIDYLEGKSNVELNDYSFSGIWDIMDVPGELKYSKSKIEYVIRIRRKTLFYTVILIIPTVLMAFLSMMVFYLPAEASEKITLAISILLALVVFLLLVSKILPPTSSTIPLMAKYLLLTFVMNIVTILVTVIIINVYFRGPTTHCMPPWVRYLFLQLLPKFLMMKRPRKPEDIYASLKESAVPNGGPAGGPVDLLSQVTPGHFIEMTQVHHPYCSKSMQQHNHKQDNGPSSPSMTQDANANHEKALGHLSPEAYKAIEAIEYITEHLKQDDEYKKTRDDWKYVAMVIDRLLLYIFFGVTMGGTCGILLSAPNVFDYVDQATVIQAIKAAANKE